MTARELYDTSIRKLPAGERLRLASLILDDLAASATGLDIRDEWTDQDVADLATYSLKHAAGVVSPEDGNA